MGTEIRYRVRGGLPLRGHGLRSRRQERGFEDDRRFAANGQGPDRVAERPAD